MISSMVRSLQIKIKNTCTQTHTHLSLCYPDHLSAFLSGLAWTGRAEEVIEKSRGGKEEEEVVGVLKQRLKTKAPPEAGPLPGGSPSPRLPCSTFPTLTSGLICIPCCPSQRLFSGELLSIEAYVWTSLLVST